MSPETIQRNPTAVVLRATSSHGPLALEIPIEALPKPAETIHQLAARKAVQDLEEGRGWIFDAKDQAGVLVKDRYPSRFEDLVQREAVRLGEQFQVAGKWCSFVAVAANDKEIATRFAPGPQETDGALESSGLDFAATPPSGDVLQDFGFDSFLVDQDGSLSHSFTRRQSAGTAAPTSNHALQHHQMQLMILEQQNKKRLVMARQGHDSMAMPPFFVQYQQQQMQQRQPEGFQSLSATPIASLVPSLSGVPSPRNNSAGRGPRNVFGGIAGSAAPPPPPTTRSPIASFARARAAPEDLNMGSRGSASVHRKLKKTVSHHPEQAAQIMPLAAGLSPQSYSIPPKMKGSPPPEDWSAKSATDKVLALISMQDFEGSWAPAAVNEQITQIMGVEIPKAPAGIDQKAWTTMLLISFLEEKCPEEEGTWGLVVEKARTWLNDNVKTSWVDAEKEARVWVKTW